MHNEKNSIKVLKNILDIDQNLTGLAYLREFIKNIAINLDIKYALIGHPIDESLSFIQTDVVWAENKFVENFKYELKDTPCELVITGERVCIHEKNVCLEFPDDELLQEMKIQSYIGAPVVSKNASGVSSILVLLDDKPMLDRDFIISITDFLALRASAEIEKHHIEEILKNKVNIKTKQLKETKKILANELKKSKRKSNKFFELSNNYLLISDFEGNILEVNSAWTSKLGYQEEQLINKNFLELVHPDDISATINEMKKLESGKSVEYFENRYIDIEGNYKILAWSANYDLKDGFIYASAHDVTDFKEKDKIILSQSKKAVMGEMIDNIAHQWRQPLSIISTQATGVKLKNELEILQSKEITESMNTINKSVQHLSQTINDFRNFYRKGNKIETISLENTFYKTFDLISSQFKTSDINIIKDFDDVSLNTSESELIQVLINIINNARDELVKINLDEKYIFINTKVDKDKLNIIIKDNAGGIPENIINKIFEHSFTTKEESGGTGIGLHMSKMIVNEHMNGDIFVENKSYIYNNNAYAGAEFKICIPL